MSKHYEMFWDCASCGTKKLLGVTHRHCPNCGKAQDEEKRYFPKPNEEIEIKNHIYYGIDWDCQYCSTPNSLNAKNCINCGAGADGTKPVVRVHERQPKNHNTTRPQTPTNSAYNTQPAPKNKSNALAIAIGIFFFIFIAFIVAGLTIKNEETTFIQSKSWQRTIDIQKYTAQVDSDWCSSKPVDAYKIHKTREIRDYKQVENGQSCSTSNVDKGDGSYAKQTTCVKNYKSVPIYDDRCHYTIDRWSYSHSLVSQGDHQRTPYWHEVGQLTNNALNRLGNERLSTRQEKYTVYFQNSNKQEKTKVWQCTFNESVWQNYQINKEFKIKVNMFGIADCSSLQNSVLASQ